jgi:hypothetical protein
MGSTKTIDEAVASLQAHFDEPDVFNVRHQGGVIIVDVNFIYRVDEVPSEWEGYQVTTGRRSCW